MIISYRISLLYSIRLDFDNVYASDTPTIINNDTIGSFVRKNANKRVSNPPFILIYIAYNQI